jgi:predicted metal-dependent hydrolase
MPAATIKIQDGILKYTIKTRPRIKRRLYLERDEQGGLVVFAPGHWPKRYIEASMAQNIQRVERFLSKTNTRQLAPLQYASGETHLYLGELLLLTIHHSGNARSQVEVIDGEIRVATPTPQSEKVRLVLQSWYLRQARVVFASRLSDIANRAPWTRDKCPELKLRRMKRTWGNCSTSGVVKLNTHLAKAPLEIIDSVIAHEICHLQEMNHSGAFYALLDDLDPDWRHHRSRLKSDGFNYLRT